LTEKKTIFATILKKLIKIRK